MRYLLTLCFSLPFCALETQTKHSKKEQEEQQSSFSPAGKEIISLLENLEKNITPEMIAYKLKQSRGNLNWEECKMIRALVKQKSKTNKHFEKVLALPIREAFHAAKELKKRLNLKDFLTRDKISKFFLKFLVSEIEQTKFSKTHLKTDADPIKIIEDYIAKLPFIIKTQGSVGENNAPFMLPLDHFLQKNTETITEKFKEYYIGLNLPDQEVHQQKIDWIICSYLYEIFLDSMVQILDKQAPHPLTTAKVEKCWIPENMTATDKSKNDHYNETYLDLNLITNLHIHLNYKVLATLLRMSEFNGAILPASLIEKALKHIEKYYQALKAEKDLAPCLGAPFPHGSRKKILWQGKTSENCEALFLHSIKNIYAHLTVPFPQSRVSKSQNVRILSLDGGGVRGLIEAKILQNMIEDLLKDSEARLILEQIVRQRIPRSHVIDQEKLIYYVEISDIFHMISGTSTGGILAFLAASGYSAPEIVRLYKDLSSQIFVSLNTITKYIYTLTGTTYSHKPLEGILSHELRNKRLSEVKHVDLAITGYNVTTQKMELFSTRIATQHKNSNRFDPYLVDLGRITSAAPSYLPGVWHANQVYVDGGLGANNPAQLCFEESKKMNPRSKPLMVSIGTGTNPPEPIMTVSDTKGLRGALASILQVIDIQVKNVEDRMLFLKKEKMLSRYFRFNPALPRKIDLADSSAQSLIELEIAGDSVRGTKDWQKMIEEIKKSLIAEHHKKISKE